ncbi:MAG: glycoside hydrolase [Treponemataceae bacterium]|nr:glycoside hydrolase [Treponemataceae bacterium]
MRISRKFFCFILFFIVISSLFSATPKKSREVYKVEKIADLPAIVEKEFPEKIKFKEVWNYVVEGREGDFAACKDSVTDIGYFGATIDTFGDLVGLPKLENLPYDSKHRVHFVVVDSSRSLTHFCISRKYSVRNRLINQILKASKPYDGVQIDFELVSASDAKEYYSFLRELRRRLPRKKILSIAIPARVKTLQNDAYNYEILTKIVDRIVVMAYDEHWSTSVPGPVASMEWCKRIMDYSKTIIPPEKLIMGTPFYGRCWNTDDTAGAYKFTSTKRVQKEEKITEISRFDDIPSFKVKKEVVYQFYYDDLYSMLKRLDMYADNQVQNVSFWRSGQEDAEIWNHIEILE